MIILFDLSGVFFNNGLKLAIKQVEERFGISEDIMKYVLNGEFAIEYRTGLIEPEDFWYRVSDYLDLDIEDVEIIREIFFEAYYPSDEIIEIVQDLRGAGVEPAYISNGPRDRTEYLDEKYDFISLFDFGLFSFEAGYLKPVPEIYNEFLLRFDINPKDVLYIDDKINNIEAAKSLGITSFLYEDPDKLILELMFTDK